MCQLIYCIFEKLRGYILQYNEIKKFLCLLLIGLFDFFFFFFCFCWDMRTGRILFCFATFSSADLRKLQHSEAEQLLDRKFFFSYYDKLIKLLHIL